MDIKLHEFKKVITSPVIIALTALFVLFNLLGIYHSSYMKNDIKVINQMIGEFGQEINDKTISNMESESNSNLKKINVLTKDKFNKIYESIGAFIESEEFQSNIYDENTFTKEEKEFFDEAIILDLYSNIAMDFVADYENLDMIQIGEAQIKAYKVEGKAKEIARENYKKLDVRFNELKENEEHKNFFFSGKLHKTHSLLFGDTLAKCIFEIVILVVLISTYLINYEFYNKTSLIVYSTKRGRNNTKDKLIVCIMSSLIVSVVILGITLLAYFINFDYSNVWNVPISNVFNWEYPIPYISWFNISIKEYLILSLLVILICVPIFSSITFIISKIVKNSYIVFFVFFIVFGINMMVPTLISTSSPLIMNVGYDVFNLILSPSNFFMQRGPFNLNKYYEVITLLSWTIIVLIGNKYVIGKFKKQDIS